MRAEVIDKVSNRTGIKKKRRCRRVVKKNDKVPEKKRKYIQRYISCIPARPLKA